MLTLTRRIGEEVVLVARRDLPAGTLMRVRVAGGWRLRFAAPLGVRILRSELFEGQDEDGEAGEELDADELTAGILPGLRL